MEGRRDDESVSGERIKGYEVGREQMSNCVFVLV